MKICKIMYSFYKKFKSKSSELILSYHWGNFETISLFLKSFYLFEDTYVVGKITFIKIEQK